MERENENKDHFQIEIGQKVLMKSDRNSDAEKKITAKGSRNYPNGKLIPVKFTENLVNNSV